MRQTILGVGFEINAFFHEVYYPERLSRVFSRPIQNLICRVWSVVFRVIQITFFTHMRQTILDVGSEISHAFFHKVYSPEMLSRVFQACRNRFSDRFL